MKQFSIGSRLTLFYCIIFAVAQLLFGLGMWVALRQNLYEIADDALEGQIDDVQRFLEAQRKDATVAKLQEEINETFILEHSGDYLQIRSPQGEWIYRAAFLQKYDWDVPPGSALHKPVYESRTIAGEPFRFLTEIITVDGRSFIVQSGQSERDTRRTLNSFRSNLLLSALFILVLGSGVGYWLSRKALAPVDAITKTAKSISAANLGSRLNRLHTGDELQRLSDTLNDMLERIENSFQRVSQFTADASHELRTPISLMRTEAEIALRRSRGEAEYRDALEHILLEAEKTSTLIEKLLFLARADVAQQTLDLAPTDLRDVVGSCTNAWRHEAEAHGLSLKTRLGNHELFVSADKTSLNRLLNILLDNAIKYTPAPGSIEVVLNVEPEAVMLSVRDSGIGISEEDKPRIFERFYRADKARSRELGGVGLGLSMAHWIVQQHHGSISVASSPGNGSTFSLSLPMQAQGEITTSVPIS